MVGNILAVGLMSLGMGMSSVKDEPQMYAQNAETYTINYNAEDWARRASNIYTWLIDNSYSQNATTKLAVQATISNYPNANLTKMYANSTSGAIILTTDGGQTYSYKTTYWENYMGTEFTLEQLSITSQTYYEEFAEPEPDMGGDIIGSIASGLGLIGALATEFLAGFGALFYAQGALTPFAIFSLVMLGVAVSFAIVKLVLALIRSNTGA